MFGKLKNVLLPLGTRNPLSPMQENFVTFGLAIGQVSPTGRFFFDVALGKSFPIYQKRLAVPALGASAAVNVLHTEANIKLDGHLEIAHLQCSSGAAGVTARTNKNSPGLSFGFTATQLVITDTTDLSAQSGSAVIEFCRTND